MLCKRFSLKELWNEEWFQFHTEFKTLFDRSVISPAFIDFETWFASYKTKYADAEKALEKINKSVTTPMIVEADKVRRKTFLSLKHAIRPYNTYFDVSKREAALRMSLVCDQYGDINRKTYANRTASIFNFIQEMNTERQADVATLGFAEWISRLNTDNQRFEALINQRFDERSKATKLRMADVRIIVDNSYKDLIDTLDAHTVLKNGDQFQDFISKLGLRVDAYKDMIAQRKGMRKAKDKLKAKPKYPYL